MTSIGPPSKARLRRTGGRILQELQIPEDAWNGEFRPFHASCLFKGRAFHVCVLSVGRRRLVRNAAPTPPVILSEAKDLSRGSHLLSRRRTQDNLGWTDWLGTHRRFARIAVSGGDREILHCVQDDSWGGWWWDRTIRVARTGNHRGIAPTDWGWCVANPGGVSYV
jgi:hypothetical protein